MGLVMIHGVLSDARQWYDVAARIPGAIATERLGPAEPGYDLSAEVQHAHELLDAAGPDTILFGHSYGAVIALLVAQQRDDLRSVVLYEPVATGRQLRDFVGTAPERALEAVRDNDLNAAMEIIVTEVSPTPPELLPRYRRSSMWQSQLKFVPAATAELQALLNHELDYGQAAKPQAPTRVILGAKNVGSMPFGVPSETLAKAIDAELVLLKDLGHVAHLEAPDVLAEAITS
ncbi:MAG: alpha/beta hydrolase [Kibdelosporangium sp.]